MGDEKEWVIKLKDDLDRMPDPETQAKHWEKRSIYKVPAYVTDVNKNAYSPQAVSFGPYHHGEEHLMPMEEHKHRALRNFLRRSEKPLELYVNSLAEDVQSLKESYDSLDSAWERDDDNFLLLMILDSCFMLEVLRTDIQYRAYYAQNDPIFSYHGMLHIMPYIKSDMLLLENQLPMLVLYKLVAVESAKAKQDEESVNRLIIKFCSPYARFPADSSMGKCMQQDEESVPNPWDLPQARVGKCLHPLDVYRKGMLREHSGKIAVPGRSRSRAPKVNQSDEIIRSAMELNYAGIKFKKSKRQEGISFSRGVLRLPPIVVDEATESIFLNLIAFERFHARAWHGVTSYFLFMGNIIDSAEDIRLLRSLDIIQNDPGSDKNVAKLFNSLSMDITFGPGSSLYAVQKEVNEYYEKHVWRAYLKRNYFRSPWAIVSVIPAIILFVLTVAQQIYTIYRYYYHK